MIDSTAWAQHPQKYLRRERLEDDTRTPSTRELEMESARKQLRMEFASKLRTFDHQEFMQQVSEFNGWNAQTCVEGTNK